ncbi:MAG: tetratricopeptide repeat protein, partial [Myxococcota bacterium]
LPGRLIATLEAWVMDDALVATDDGFALRDERTLGDLPRLGVTPDEELARLYEAWWACRRLNQPRKGARLARQRARLVARLGLPDTDRRRSEALFQEITSGYEAVGRPTRVAKARELARLAERHGWTDLEALGRTQLGMVLLDRAEDGEEGMAQLERGAALGAMSATLMAQGNALTNLGAQLAGRGRLDEAGARFREAEALGRDVVPGESDWDARVRSGVLHSALVGRAWLALHQETPEAAIAHAEEAVAVAPSGAVEGMNMLGMILSTVGRTDEAITWRERALASIREQGLRIAEGILLHYLADDYMALGRRDEARTALMRALETFRDRDATDTTIRVRLARLALEEQAWDEADAILDEVDDDRPIHVLLVALHRLTASIGRGLDSRSVATALDHAEEHFAVHAVTDIHVQAATEAVADQLTARGAPPELIARVRDFVERQRRTLARP